MTSTPYSSSVTSAPAGFGQVRKERALWDALGLRLPAAGIVLIVAPSGYDKSAFATTLLADAPNGDRAFVSLDGLDGSTAALFQAVSSALQLDVAVHQLASLLIRAHPPTAVQMIAAATHDFQSSALTGRLLILDGVEALGVQAQSALTELFLQTHGSVTPRVVVCARSEELLPLRVAGVPVTLISEADLALSSDELRALGLVAGSGGLDGWPLGVRTSMQGTPHALKVMLGSWLGQLDKELLTSLENATLEPRWPPAPGVMEALNIRSDFVSQALLGRLPIIRQPDGTYRPHPLLLELLTARLKAQSARHGQLQRAYAQVADLDSGRVLRALNESFDARRFAELVSVQDDLPTFVQEYAETILSIHEKHGLGREPAVLVQLARIQAQAGDTRKARQTLTRAQMQHADPVEVALVDALLWSMMGTPDRMLAAMDVAVQYSDARTAEGAAIRAVAALRHVSLYDTGFTGSDLLKAQMLARAALNAPFTGETSVIAHVVLARIGARRRQGQQDDSAHHMAVAYQEARLLMTCSADLIGALLLMTEQLADGGQLDDAAACLHLMSCQVQQGSVAERIELPLAAAHVALRAAQPAEAHAHVSRAHRHVQADPRGVSRRLQLKVLGTLLHTQLFRQDHAWARQESRIQVSTYRQLSATEGGLDATVLACEAWVQWQEGQTTKTYAAMSRLLPELLETRSVLYVPLLVLLTRDQHLPDGLKRLQEARTQFGPGTVNSAVRMLAPEVVIPESPHLNVRLFGDVRVELDGQPVSLRPRAMVALAILILNGPCSRSGLADALQTEQTGSTAVDQAIGDLRKALRAVTQDEQPITQASGPRATYSLQRYDLTCDYFRLPSLDAGQRRDLIERSFMRGFNYEWARARRAEFSASIGPE